MNNTVNPKKQTAKRHRLSSILTMVVAVMAAVALSPAPQASAATSNPYGWRSTSAHSVASNGQWQLVKYGWTLTDQADGNLVLRDPQGNPKWQSGTSGYTDMRTTFQNDGNIVKYNKYGTPLWSTNSGWLRDACSGGCDTFMISLDTYSGHMCIEVRAPAFGTAYYMHEVFCHPL